MSNLNKLPEFCYSTLPSNEKEMIIIKKGESGYHPIDILSDAYLCSAERNNELIGVNKGQATAMKIGSMFGWDSPGANPDNYDEKGQYIK